MILIENRHTFIEKTKVKMHKDEIRNIKNLCKIWKTPK